MPALRVLDGYLGFEHRWIEQLKRSVFHQSPGPVGIRQGAVCKRDQVRRDRLRALLAPTSTATAPSLAGEAAAQRARLLEAAVPFSQTGGPILALPVGTADTGMPIGVQLAGHGGDEVRLLAIARSAPQLEESSVAIPRRPPIA